MPIMLSIAGITTVGGSLFLAFEAYEQARKDYLGLFGTWKHLATDALAGFLALCATICGFHAIFSGLFA